jgi:hypothetical protein
MNMLLLTLTLASQHPDTATFVTRIGKDTLAVERFVYDGHELDGVSVVRSPSVEVRRYHAVFGPSGAESLTIATGPAGKPVAQVTIYRYTGDSVFVENRRDTGSKREAGAAHGRPLPFAPDLLGPWEAALSGTVANTAADPRMSLLAGRAPIQYEVHRGGADTLHLVIGDHDYGPLVARIDAAGRLQSLDLRATTDKFLAERVSGLDVDSMTAVYAARELAGAGMGALSPRDTARATVGSAHVQIDYGRPMRRGRTIFGNVVPWDTVWRTGANQATQLVTDKDLMIGGTTVPAGTYSLFTIPSPKGWQLIINRQHGQWGTDYDAKQDFARIPMRFRSLATPTERFTIVTRGSDLVISWDLAEAAVDVKAR